MLRFTRHQLTTALQSVSQHRNSLYVYTLTMARLTWEQTAGGKVRTARSTRGNTGTRAGPNGAIGRITYRLDPRVGPLHRRRVRLAAHASRPRAVRLEVGRPLTAQPPEVQVDHHVLQQPISELPMGRRRPSPRTRLRRFSVKVAHEDSEVTQREHLGVQHRPVATDFLSTRLVRRGRRHAGREEVYLTLIRLHLEADSGIRTSTAWSGKVRGVSYTIRLGCGRTMAPTAYIRRRPVTYLVITRSQSSK
jgi:hypothetical protein